MFFPQIINAHGFQNAIYTAKTNAVWIRSITEIDFTTISNIMHSPKIHSNFDSWWISNNIHAARIMFYVDFIVVTNDSQSRLIIFDGNSFIVPDIFVLLHFLKQFSFKNAIKINDQIYFN